MGGEEKRKREGWRIRAPVPSRSCYPMQEAQAQEVQEVRAVKAGEEIMARNIMASSRGGDQQATPGDGQSANWQYNGGCNY